MELTDSQANSLIQFDISGAEGQNRMRLRRNTGIFRPDLLKFKNAVITGS